MNVKMLSLFLILNFAALGLGGFFTSDAVVGEWYQALNKAPWTPPGWVFGAAWTTIMIFFAAYMAYAWEAISDHKYLREIYATQWVLNVIWNPIFFSYHQMLLGLVVIIALTLLMLYFFMAHWKELNLKSLLVLPYFIWLVIATSLNFYAYWYN